MFFRRIRDKVSAKTFALQFSVELCACIASQTNVYKGCITIWSHLVSTHTWAHKKWSQCECLYRDVGWFVMRERNTKVNVHVVADRASQGQLPLISA